MTDAAIDQAIVAAIILMLVGAVAWQIIKAAALLILGDEDKQ